MVWYDPYKFRGIALVIGNEKFDTKQGELNIDRGGCLHDIQIMKRMFEKLDFFVMCYKDLSAAKMKEKIQKATSDPKNKDCECFVLALSTHGDETFNATAKIWQHEVMGADRNKVLVEDIIDLLNSASDLAGKPKIFFIQACRSRDVLHTGPIAPDDDHGVMAKVPVPAPASSVYLENNLPPKFDDDEFNLQCDKLYPDDWILDEECWTPAKNKQPGSQDRNVDAAGDAGGSGDSNELPPEPVDILKIKCPEDFLLYYPVISGKGAFRYPDGSMMMTCLKNQFPKLLRGMSLTKYLTFVNRAMADWLVEDGILELKVTASMLHRMTKHLKFEPKSANSPMAEMKKLII